MELIRISQHKLKIMLTESDMQIYEIPESYGGGDADIREALRAVLTEAGKRTGLDFSGRKYTFPVPSGYDNDTGFFGEFQLMYCTKKHLAFCAFCLVLYNFLLMFYTFSTHFQLDVTIFSCAATGFSHPAGLHKLQQPCWEWRMDNGQWTMDNY